MCTTGSTSGTNGGSSGAGAYAEVALFDFPNGADLAPTNPCDLGSASPAQPVLVGGSVWVTLGNLDPSFAPAGPSYLGELDTSSGALATFQLPGCLNAQGMALVSGSNLLIACTNNYANPGEALLFDTATRSVSATFATGGAPTSVSVAGTNAFLPDATGSGVIVVDLTAAAAIPVAFGPAAAPDGGSSEAVICPNGFLAGLATGPSSPQALALCSAQGAPDLVTVLDQTGTPIAGGVEAYVDPGATALNYLQTVGTGANAYDTFVVLSGLSDAAQYLQWPTGGQFLLGPSTLLPVGSGANSASAIGAVGYLTLSTLNQVGLIDLASTTPRLAAIAQLPAGSDPYYLAAVDPQNAWVTLLSSNQLAHLAFVADLDGGAFDAGPVPVDAGPPPDSGVFLPDGGYPYVAAVLAYDAGPGGGYGSALLPGIVEGPPIGGGLSQGSLNVVSLGTRGVIVVYMGQEIVDGPGIDFTVFENPFDYLNGVYAEPGAVAVSDDGGYFVEFPCNPDAGEVATCAGMHPVFSNPSNGISPLDPLVSGGDTFDLSAIGVNRARYIRIRDMGLGPPPQVPPTEGFDLDAIAVLNAGP